MNKEKIDAYIENIEKLINKITIDKELSNYDKAVAYERLYELILKLDSCKLV